ncbi:MAG: hypothetical protein WKF84_07400 [Pyrinomonadaceae bacterium]
MFHTRYAEEGPQLRGLCGRKSGSWKEKIEARLRKQEAIKIIWINANTAIDGAVGW